MEYVYASLLLHHAGKPINEENVRKIMEAVGIQPDEVKIKALVAALKEVNIEEALKTAAMPAVAAPATAPSESPQPSEEKRKEEEEKKEAKEEAEEEIAEGLSALFG